MKIHVYHVSSGREIKSLDVHTNDYFSGQRRFFFFTHKYLVFANHHLDRPVKVTAFELPDDMGDGTQVQRPIWKQEDWSETFPQNKGMTGCFESFFWKNTIWVGDQSGSSKNFQIVCEIRTLPMRYKAIFPKEAFVCKNWTSKREHLPLFCQPQLRNIHESIFVFSTTGNSYSIWWPKNRNEYLKWNDESRNWDRYFSILLYGAWLYKTEIVRLYRQNHFVVSEYYKNTYHIIFN